MVVTVTFTLMKTIVHSFIFTTLCAAMHAVEPGFIPLLDKDHTDGWEWTANEMTLMDGIWDTHRTKKRGANHYLKRIFTDFVLRLEFKADQPTSNSGIFLRSPVVNAPSESRYEVQIYGRSNQDQPTGSIWSVQTPISVPLKKIGEWNEMEITAVGQQYTVRLNGQVINQFEGSKSTGGFIALQSHNKGAVQIRNVCIKDLSAPTATSSSAAALASIQTDANQPRIEVIKDQGPNATEWALTPLHEAIPADIRQNLTFLREDLLDEGKKAAKSSPEAYKLASDYCDKILTALDQRDLARVNAGYRASQADADKRTSTQALDARRNHQMSWPQYAREESQRTALRENETDKADVKKERLKVDWATRSVRMRSYLDDLYRQLREAMR